MGAHAALDSGLVGSQSSSASRFTANRLKSASITGGRAASVNSRTPPTGCPAGPRQPPRPLHPLVPASPIAATFIQDALPEQVQRGYGGPVVSVRVGSGDGIVRPPPGRVLRRRRGSTSTNGSTSGLSSRGRRQWMHLHRPHGTKCPEMHRSGASQVGEGS